MGSTLAFSFQRCPETVKSLTLAATPLLPGLCGDIALVAGFLFYKLHLGRFLFFSEPY
jgi:hypothetical protein